MNVAMITPIQSQVLTFIKDFNETQRCSPTYWEISQHFSWTSQNAALTHVRALAKRGYLHIVPHIARGIRVTDPPPPVVNDEENTDWDEICRDAERYRYLRDRAGNGIMKRLMETALCEKWDSLVDHERGVE